MSEDNDQFQLARNMGELQVEQLDEAYCHQHQIERLPIKFDFQSKAPIVGEILVLYRQELEPHRWLLQVRASFVLELDIGYLSDIRSSKRRWHFHLRVFPFCWEVKCKGQIG